jgi:hypothetical protein
MSGIEGQQILCSLLHLKKLVSSPAACLLSVRYSKCPDLTGNLQDVETRVRFPTPTLSSLIVVEYDILAEERRKVLCRYGILVTLFPHLPSPTFS